MNHVLIAIVTGAIAGIYTNRGLVNDVLKTIWRWNNAV
jgi:hypothetical protein